MLDFYYFLLLLSGIGHLYILYGIGGYYKKIRYGIIKKLIGKSDDSALNEVSRESIIIGYFNLFTNLIILIGLITVEWFYFLLMFSSLFILNILRNKIELIPEKIDRMLFFSKLLAYVIISIKIIGLLFLSLRYFHV